MKKVRVKEKKHIKERVYGEKKTGSSAFSFFFSEEQAKADVMCSLFCGNIISTGFKGTTPVCRAYKRFKYSVGFSNGQHCFAIMVVFVNKSDLELSEADVITAFPVLV